MITHPTVFILGAGSGIPLGFPLGYQLVEYMVQHLNGAGLYDRVIRSGYRDWFVKKFRDRLKGSQLYSIDSFLQYADENLLKIGKFCIAQSILRYENMSIVQDKPYFDYKANHWLKLIWNHIHGKLENFKDIRSHS